MRLLHCSLLPLFLTGCAAQKISFSEPPALDFVEQIISQQMPVIKNVQDELVRVTRPREPRKIASPTQPTISKQTKNMAVAMKGMPSKSSLKPSLYRPSITNRTVPHFIKSSGKAHSLREATTKLMPINWKASYASTVNPDKRENLRWQGNDQWIFVLNKILAEKKLQAKTNDRSKTVTITDQSIKTALIPVITPKKGALVSHKSGVSQAVKISPKPEIKPDTLIKKPQPAPLPVWDIKAGITLKDAMFVWADKAPCTLANTKWTVVWKTAVNYRIDAPLQFKGTYKEALTALFKLYIAVDKPLFVGVQTPQCVLVVDDKELL